MPSLLQLIGFVILSVSEGPLATNYLRFVWGIAVLKIGLFQPSLG